MLRVTASPESSTHLGVMRPLRLAVLIALVGPGVAAAQDPTEPTPVRFALGAGVNLPLDTGLPLGDHPAPGFVATVNVTTGMLGEWLAVRPAITAHLFRWDGQRSTVLRLELDAILRVPQRHTGAPYLMLGVSWYDATFSCDFYFTQPTNRRATLPISPTVAPSQRVCPAQQGIDGQIGLGIRMVPRNGVPVSLEARYSRQGGDFSGIAFLAILEPWR